MKLLIKPQCLLEIVIFDGSYLLNTLKDNNINIYNLRKIDSYTYRFYCSVFSIKKIKSIFSSCKIIKYVGLLSSIFSLLKYKTLIVAIIISSFFYISLSSRTWIINISGDNDLLNEVIKSNLKDNNIYIGSKNKTVDEISYIQNKILFENNNLIEYLSIEKQGSCINVSFKKKREETKPNELKKSLYASKDGLIKSFDLLTGEKVVDVNDYVKKGDLLVKDVITTDYNQDIYIGTFGSVYAYTWYYVSLQSIVNIPYNKEEILANCLLLSKSKIIDDFTDNEYIYEENVLQFNIENNKVYFKVHFTCVEDIAKE